MSDLPPVFDAFDQTYEKIMTNTCKTCGELKQKATEVHKKFDNRVKALKYIKDNAAREGAVKQLDATYRQQFIRLSKVYNDTCKGPLCEPLPILPEVPNSIFTMAFKRVGLPVCNMEKVNCDRITDEKSALCCIYFD